MHASLVFTVSCTQVLSYMQVYCIVHASTKSYRIMQTSTTGVDTQSRNPEDANNIAKETERSHNQKP